MQEVAFNVTAGGNSQKKAKSTGEVVKGIAADKTTLEPSRTVDDLSQLEFEQDKPEEVKVGARKLSGESFLMEDDEDKTD